MANREQLRIVRQGVKVWNKWRKKNSSIVINLKKANLKGAILERVDFSDADLRGANLRGAKLFAADFNSANLSDADLEGAELEGADLSKANLTEAILDRADLTDASLIEANLTDALLLDTDLTRADLFRANLRNAYLCGAVLRETDLTEADLSESNLKEAVLFRAVVKGAKVSNSFVHGINVWDLYGEFEEQKDIDITDEGEPRITVDNIKIAQFVRLILNNAEIREVINTLTSKSVLILGRFTPPERKIILDALRNKIREHNLLPIVFDFDHPNNRDFTETVKTLAGLSYFVIADITNPRSAPLELQATVPDYQIPFVPIIQEGENPFAMMVDLQKKYNWVLNTISYDSEETLMKVLKPLIIDPAMKKRQELRIIKAQEPEIISAKDYLDKGKK